MSEDQAFFNVVIAFVPRPGQQLLFTIDSGDEIWQFLLKSPYAQSLDTFATATLVSEFVANIIEFLHKNLTEPSYEKEKICIRWFSRNTAGTLGNSSHSADVFTLQELRERSIYSTSQDICLAYAFGILEIIFYGMHVCKQKVRFEK